MRIAAIEWGIAVSLLSTAWDALAMPDLCPVRVEQRMVRGMSMSPLINEGQMVEIERGYYDCHPVSSGDIIAFNHGGRDTPIIKIVKGIPGDRFETRLERSAWRILVNGELMRNSENVPYALTEGGRRILELYMHDYHNTIPDGAYLILGDRPEGSYDSTQFGLASATDILGKVAPGYSKPARFFPARRAKARKKHRPEEGVFQIMPSTL